MNGFDLHDLILLIIAALNLYAAIQARRTHVLTKQVEIATNSMKDALVVAEKKLSFSEGREEMRGEQTPP